MMNGGRSKESSSRHRMTRNNQEHWCRPLVIVDGLRMNTRSLSEDENGGS